MLCILALMFLYTLNRVLLDDSNPLNIFISRSPLVLDLNINFILIGNRLVLFQLFFQCTTLDLIFSCIKAMESHGSKGPPTSQMP